MQWAPAVELEDDFGKQTGNLVVDGPKVEWHRYGYVFRRFTMDTTVVAAIFTRYAKSASPDELWAVIVCEDRLVHSFGLNSGREHVMGISFKPTSVVPCLGQGVVFTSRSKTAQLDVFMLQGPEELLKSVVNSSVTAPLHAEDELVFCDEVSAVVWNSQSCSVTVYALRMLQHQHHQTNNLTGFDAVSKAAVFSPVREWTQQSIGTVFSQKLESKKGYMTLVASHDPVSGLLFVLCGSDLLQHHNIDHVAPVLGIHGYPGVITAPGSSGSLNYSCLFFPQISPLSIALEPCGELTKIYTECNYNWVEAHADKVQRFALVAPSDPVVCTCFDIGIELFGVTEMASWLSCFLAERSGRDDDFSAFAASLESMAEHANPALLSQFVVYLHLLREELSVMSIYEDYTRLFGEVIKKYIYGWGPEWSSAYESLDASDGDPDDAPDVTPNGVPNGDSTADSVDKRRALPCLVASPPSIFSALAFCIDPAAGRAFPGFAGHERFFPNSNLLLSLFQLLASSTSREEIKQFLTANNMAAKVDAFAPGIRACLLEVFNLVVYSAQDMARQRRGSGQHSKSKRQELIRGLFRYDLRYTEALRLLQTKEPQKCLYGVYVDPETIPEHEVARVQKEWGEALASRALATSFGRAALELDSVKPLLWEQFEPIAIDFSGECTETALSIAPVYKTLEAAGEADPWGVFAHGAALGLAVCSQSPEIDSLWVITSAQLNSVSTDLYSGFVYGMGLSGHLAKLEDWQFYESLVSSNTRGTMAALLGVAASKIGSRDAKLTKVLSVHIRALLPSEAHSAQFVPQEVERAALVSLGLLYMGQGVRHHTEVLSRHLSWMPDTDAEVDGDNAENNEAHKLAVGISLGLINCGCASASGLQSLLPLITKLHDRSVYASEIVSGATCAILLSFTGSNDELVASQLKLPHTRAAAEYSTPQAFFARALTHHLVMWDSCEASEEWVLANVPSELKPSGSTGCMDALWYQHALAGVMCAVSMRNVATNSDRVIDMLLTLIEREFYKPYIAHVSTLMQTARAEPLDPEKTTELDYNLIQSIKHLASLLSALALATSAVAAGSGHLMVLRLLRKLWQVSPQVQDSLAPDSGSYYAGKVGLDLGCISQAIGWLFMAGCQRSLKADPQSVSVLACFSFLGVLGGANIEVEQWQHLRLLWALVTEPRCLYAEHNPSEDVHIKLKLKDGGDAELRQLPLMLPPLSTIENIEVVDERFVPQVITQQDLEMALKMGVSLTMKETGRHTLESMLPLSKPKAKSDNVAVRALRATLETMARHPSSLAEQEDLKLLLSFSETWPLDDDSRLLKKRDIEQLKFLLWYRQTNSHQHAYSI